jgi:branched-subunit amino acid aminotransferase/4-amino-4-deoxychorismate lyase
MADEELRRALVDGAAMPLAQARLSVLDDGVARGDGAFETIGVWGGRPFRIADHLERLERSLTAIALPPPDRALIEQEAAALCDGVTADAALRIYVTASGTRLLTLDHQPQRPDIRWLLPLPAPWIRPLGSFDPAGAKSMSYMPNMAATRAAQRAGADDALLISHEGYVLEGPTFGVCWVVGETVHAPDVTLGIVDSISRRSLLRLAVEEGLEVVTGRWALPALAEASELLICSSVRDVIAVQRAGEHSFDGPTPIRDVLSRALAAARRGGWEDRPGTARRDR